MRRLSLSDTIFYNLGDCYMNAVAVLDGPCDLAVLLAEMEGVIEALPALTEQSVRVGLWTFAKRSSGPIDLAKHVSIIRDPSITRFEQLVPRMDKQRRNPIRIDGPPWRVFVLNPAEPGKEPKGNRRFRPSSCRFAMAWRTRYAACRSCRGWDATRRPPRHRALAARIPVVEPLEFETASPSTIPAFRCSRFPGAAWFATATSSERLAAVAATAGRRPVTLPRRPAAARQCRADPLRPAARPQNGVGNHLKMVTVSTKEKKPKEEALRHPGPRPRPGSADHAMAGGAGAAAARAADDADLVYEFRRDGDADPDAPPARCSAAARSARPSAFRRSGVRCRLPRCPRRRRELQRCAVPGNGFTANARAPPERLTRLLNPEDR